MEKETVQGLNKETILGMLKSKTINVNVALTVIIVAVANAYGVPLTSVEAAAVVSILYGGVNVILRFLTKKPLPEKGLSVPNPAYVQNFVKTLGENEEALEELYTAIAKWKNEKLKKKE